MEPNENTNENTNVTTASDEASEIERLREEARREHEMYMRALADFDNYRRRVERDRETATQSGKRALILSLLEVLDSFEAALQHAGGAPSSMAAGIQAIYRKLLSVLEAQGVTQFRSMGTPFDPEHHEAIGSVPSTDYLPGTVVEELQPGYRWGDQVLRPARVRVAQ
jgi:molecular chaperone GrpE